MKRVVIFLVVLFTFSSCNKNIGLENQTNEVTEPTTASTPMVDQKIQKELWNGVYYEMGEKDLLAEFPELSINDDEIYSMGNYAILEVPYRVGIELDENRTVESVSLVNENQNLNNIPSERHAQDLLDLFTSKYGDDYSLVDSSQEDSIVKSYSWIIDKSKKIELNMMYFSSFAVRKKDYPQLNFFTIGYTHINDEETLKI